MKDKKLNITHKTQYRLEGKSFDFYIPKYNLLIEYNGDYWHCNPNLYVETYFNKKKRMLAKDIWEYDKKKLQLSTKHGYNLEVIWESDYNKDPNIIFKILKKYE